METCLRHHDHIPSVFTGWKKIFSINNPAMFGSDSGSVVGKLVVKHHCPAARRSFHPTLYWDETSLAPSRAASAGGAQGDVDLLVGILSACRGSGARQAARDSWMR